MAKAILEFNLNDPDDLEQYNRMNKSSDLCAFIWEVVYNIKKRAINRFENEEEPDCFEAIDYVFEQIHESLHEHSINIDDLYR